MKLWQGRLSGENSEIFDMLNSSVSFDKRLVYADIKGSAAHAAMLGKCGIIPPDEASAIVEALKNMAAELKGGKLEVDESCEDVHTFLESELTKRLGDVGKKVHTGRSRNDQTALALRIYLADETEIIIGLLDELCDTLCETAEAHLESVMPGYTHLQRAQPVTLAHYMCAYIQMFLRDKERLTETLARIKTMVLGAGALAGTTYPLDREFVCAALGFEKTAQNSMDAVSDRDFACEYCFDLSTVMMHLSRFCEEIIMWSGSEYAFVSLSDEFSSGSSIMPQKKNPDSAELIRGKCARVYSDLITLLTLLKGLPLAYNKDMQEDKEAVFDAGDTVKLCLKAFNGLIETASFHTENMLKAAKYGYLNATDCADYLTKKGVPFRDAYKIAGSMVRDCAERKLAFEELSLEEFKTYSSLFEADVYEAIDILNCVKKRSLPGGPAPSAVKKQIEMIKNMK